MKKIGFALSLLLVSAFSLADTAITLYDGTTRYFQMRASPKVLTQTYTLYVPLSPGTTNQALVVQSVSGNSIQLGFANGGAGGATWGSISGTLSAQADLQAVLTSIGASTSTLSVSTASLQAQINNLGSTYLTNSSATITYLQKSSATATYLSIVGAASTYLTQSSATATYLQPSVAAATYLSQSSAVATYAQILNFASASSTGTLSASDWRAFNAKGIGTITQVIAGNALAGGGSSGAVTLNVAGVSLSTQTTGTLGIGNGGTGVTTAPDDNLMVGSGAAWVNKALPSCSGGASALTYDTASNAFGCNTISGGGGGSSPLEILVGVRVTSPTATLAFNPFQFTGAANVSTATIALNSSSVTLQGQNVIFLTSTLQPGATFFVSSGTVAGQLNITGTSGNLLQAYNGGTQIMSLTSGGAFTTSGAMLGLKFNDNNNFTQLGNTSSGLFGLELYNAGLVGWSATSSPGAAADVAITRGSAGTLYVGSGTVGSIAGGVVLSTITASSGTITALNVGSITIQGAQLSTIYLTNSSATATYAQILNFASASSTGTLSAADWRLFNSKGSGGGGSSSLAVTTGTAAGFTSVASSPTAAMNFSQSQFGVSLQGGATAYIVILDSLTFSSMTVANMYVSTLTVQGIGTYGAADYMTEGAAPPAAIGQQVFFADQSSHWLKFIPNNGQTYYVVGSSVNPTIGNVARWSANGALVDGGAGGSGAGGYATVQDEGSGLTQRTTLNFIGSGVTCVDNSGATRTDCTINSGSGSPSGGNFGIQVSSNGAFGASTAFQIQEGTFTANSVLVISQVDVSSQVAVGVLFDYSQSTMVYMSPVITKSSTYLARSTDNVILVNATSGAVVINLPPVAGSAGRQFTIKKLDSSANTVTVDAAGSETIDDDLTQVIQYQYTSITIICDGSEWYIL